MKIPQYFNTNKDKFKQSSEAVPIGFELDPITTSTHVSNRYEFDHVLKTYPHNAKRLG